MLREFNPNRAISSSMFRLFLGTVRRASHVQRVSSLATPFISSGRNFRSASFTETTRTPCGPTHSNRSSSLSLCLKTIQRTIPDRDHYGFTTYLQTSPAA